MAYLATQIIDPSMLMSSWYHPSFIGQTSHNFKNFHVLTYYISFHELCSWLCDHECSMGKMSYCFNSNGFSFLYLGMRMMNSQLFQCIIFGMVVVMVMVAWCNAFLLEEKKRLHHKMGWTQIMVNVIKPSTNATIFGCTSKVNGV